MLIISAEVFRLSTLVLAGDKTRPSSEVGAAMAARPKKSRLHPRIKPQLMIALLNSQLWDVYRDDALLSFFFFFVSAGESDFRLTRIYGDGVKANHVNANYESAEGN